MKFLPSNISPSEQPNCFSPVLTRAELILLLVEKEVRANVSQIVSILSRDVTYRDSLGPAMRKECLESALQSQGVYIDNDGDDDWFHSVEGDRSRGFKTKEAAIQDAMVEFNPLPEIFEASEHYLVSDWLAVNLEARGEMIVRHFQGKLNIWGRDERNSFLSLACVIDDILPAKLSAFTFTVESA